MTQCASMAVHMGVTCDACRKVHFVTTSRVVRLSRTFQTAYVLLCTCGEPKQFRKESLRPFRVSGQVFERRAAAEGECELVLAA